jgi:hypothetical protein
MVAECIAVVRLPQDAREVPRQTDTFETVQQEAQASWGYGIFRLEDRLSRVLKRGSGKFGAVFVPKRMYGCLGKSIEIYHL